MQDDLVGHALLSPLQADYLEARPDRILFRRYRGDLVRWNHGGHVGGAIKRVRRR